MKILFICKGSMFRSPIAAAIYNKLTNTHDAYSAGTYVGVIDEPEGRLLSDLYPTNSEVLKVTDENKIDIRNHRTIKLTPKMIADADIVVSMTEEIYAKLNRLILELIKKNNETI